MVYDFSVDHSLIKKEDILNIHQYLMVKKYKIMFDFIKKIFIRLLTKIVNNSKYVSLSNQKCTTQPTVINLHPNEYTQGLCYYPFAVNLDRYVGNYNTFNDLSDKVCVPNKTEYLKLSFFNMITGIMESKTLTKHISCECKCKLGGRKYNSNQKWNNDKY